MGGSSRSGDGDWGSFAGSSVEPLELLQHVVDKFGIFLTLVPGPDELIKKQGPRKCSPLFWGSLLAKGQKDYLQED